MEGSKENNIHTRITELEVDSGSMRSDIKSLFNVVKSVADKQESLVNKLDAMADRNRPNTLALFGAALSIAMFVATIGVLAFTPVYRDLDAMRASDNHRQIILEGIMSTRFTPENAKHLMETHDKDLGVITRVLSARINLNEERIFEEAKNNSYLRGRHDTEHLKD